MKANRVPNWIKFNTVSAKYYINGGSAVRIDKKTGEIAFITFNGTVFNFKSTRELNEWLKLVNYPPIRI